MAASERRKGAVAEREVANIFAERGFDGAKRSGDAGQPDGDLDHIPGYYVEVRRRERIDLPAWIKEVEAECPAELTPLIVFRRSRMQWQVCIPLDALIDLLRQRDSDDATANGERQAA